MKKQNETIEAVARKKENHFNSQIDAVSKELRNAKKESLKWKEDYEKTLKNNSENLVTINTLRRENKRLLAQIKEINFSVKIENQHDNRHTYSQTLNKYFFLVNY